IKKERDTSYLESILYDGELAKSDTIAIANISGSNQDEPIISRIRVLEEIRPLSEKFQPKDKVTAATGVRMQIIEKANVLPGMPFVVFKDNLDEVKKIFKQQITENIKTDKQGIIAKADSLGSLEALLSILKQEKISVVKAGIGIISKSDIISAKANLKINELDAIIIGFNVSLDEEAGELLGQNKEIKIMTDEVIYKLVDDLKEFRIQKKKEIEKKRMMGLVSLAKVKVLHNYVFRNTSPAIFGVHVEVGKITSRMNLIDGNNEKVGNVKNLQAENKSVEEASEGQELAISIPGINFERRMKEVDFLYSEIGESQFKNFRKNKDLLSQKEIALLQEIAEIKRKSNATWGGS
ncbi:MAG: hypothetical protein KJ879_00005, partial [Nanoarchaeota archaeon]|nr:hypothetical protein [Nanoarchaeota archaeon]